MRVDVAIIGGTGIGERLAGLGGTALVVPTPDGLLRGRLLLYEGVSILCVSRHSAGHKVPPHEVRYRAIALGLQQLRVKGCLSTAAVGSLRPWWGPETLVACSDFIDVSGRNQTLFGDRVVHRDFSAPFDEGLREHLLAAALATGQSVKPRGTYVNANGPRYEAPAEIRMFGIMRGDLVGMTAVSEAVAMREALVPYACLAVVTNLAAGISREPLSHCGVVDVVEKVGDDVVRLLLVTARRVATG